MIVKVVHNLFMHSRKHLHHKYTSDELYVKIKQSKYSFYKVQGSQDLCLLHLGVAPDQSATSTNLDSPTDINRINWIRRLWLIFTKEIWPVTTILLHLNRLFVFVFLHYFVGGGSGAKQRGLRKILTDGKGWENHHRKSQREYNCISNYGIWTKIELIYSDDC